MSACSHLTRERSKEIVPCRSSGLAHYCTGNVGWVNNCKFVCLFLVGPGISVHIMTVHSCNCRLESNGMASIVDMRRFRVEHLLMFPLRIPITMTANIIINSQSIDAPIRATSSSQPLRVCTRQCNQKSSRIPSRDQFALKVYRT